MRSVFGSLVDGARRQAAACEAGAPERSPLAEAQAVLMRHRWTAREAEHLKRLIDQRADHGR